MNCGSKTTVAGFTHEPRLHFCSFHFHRTGLLACWPASLLVRSWLHCGGGQERKGNCSSNNCSLLLKEPSQSICKTSWPSYSARGKAWAHPSWSLSLPLAPRFTPPLCCLWAPYSTPTFPLDSAKTGLKSLAQLFCSCKILYYIESLSASVWSLFLYNSYQAVMRIDWDSVSKTHSRVPAMW